jgi:hypothetical protein
LATTLRFTTDDGSTGLHGRVTDAMPEVVARAGSEVVYACGPNAMLAAVSAVAAALTISSRVSLEERMACGVGVQTMVVHVPSLRVVPGLNTTSMGYPIEQGVWVERCLGCGDCVLHLTMGICPISRCAKSILNGPCGGSAEGKCELGKDVDCAWHMIHERLSAFGRIAVLDEIQPPKNWSTSHHGGNRTTVREDVKIDRG